MARTRSNRAQLLLGCGGAALTASLALAPASVQAQAFQATPVVVQGNANIDRTVTGQDLIEVTTPVAVIDWTPAEDVGGNALTFLPAGNTATYFDAPGQGGFAVLNRILPATNGNVVEMNGTVISNLQTSPGVFQRGGFVAFYSPTGFLIGSTAVFDVGSLMLTTLEPSLTSFDAFSVSGGALNLNDTSATLGAINISAGATVIATPEDSFFIAAGERVNVFGDVGVNGSHAYVAAEQATLTHNNGLFDIVIPLGTSVAGAAINLNGNISGPSSNGVGDNHLIYAVGQAQTNPIQMLFGGNLGYSPAASAGIVNGEIILSANYNVNGRSVNGGLITDGINASFVSRQEQSTVTADIFVTDANITSNTLAIGTHTVNVAATAGPSVVDGTLQVVARLNANLLASNGQTMLVTGDVLVASDDFGRVGPSFIDPNAINGDAGIAGITAQTGGTVSVQGNALVSANAFAGANTATLLGGTATGGTATIGATAGTVNIAGTGRARAIANGTSVGGLVNAGAAVAGFARIFANQGGQTTITGAAQLLAIATGTNLDASFVSGGGSATGGEATATASDAGSTLTLSSGISAVASAVSGNGNSPLAGGLAIAGTAGLSAQTAGTTITAGGNVTVAANASGGTNISGPGGSAIGGRSRVSTFGGTINITGSVQAEAFAVGGNGVSGGNGTGGIAGTFAGTGLIAITGNAASIATGTGGNASIGFGGIGGTGAGGNAFVQADGTLTEDARITVGSLITVAADGTGGQGGASNGSVIAAGQGGAGSGGFFGTPNAADPMFGNGAYILAQGDRGTVTAGGLGQATATGTGGQGGTSPGGPVGGQGGVGTGGTAQIGMFIGTGNGSVSAGLTQLGSALARATGIGGAGGLDAALGLRTGGGGAASGGGAFLSVRLSDVTVGSVTLESDGNGGEGGTGGAGTGGGAAVLVTNGGNAAIASLTASAVGRGGVGTTSSGGVGTGGEALVDFQGGTLNITGGATLTADGLGGLSANANGAAGTGGEASVSNSLTNPGSATIGGALIATAHGFGGGAVTTNFTGGQGTGGQAFLLSQAGSTLQLGSAQVVASGVGGSGTSARGGNGVGGTAYIEARGTGSRVTINATPATGANLFTQQALLGSIGLGGDTNGGDGIGGDGIGGLVDVRALNGGTVTLPALGGPSTFVRLLARGRGGNSSVDGGRGGLGRAGDLTITVDAGTFEAGPVQMSSLGEGGSSANVAANITGGDGEGGQRRIVVLNGGLLTASFPAGVAGATGGDGSGTGNGGNASGGVASLEVIGSTANLIGRSIIATQNGTQFGSGVNGGDATGGQATVLVDGGGTINIVPNAAGQAELFVGSAGLARNATTGTGGSALPQDATVILNSGSIAGGNLIINSTATGGAATTGTGGVASGGTASLVMNGGSLNVGNVVVGSNATGGLSSSGIHGNSAGGVAFIELNGGTYATPGSTQISANGTTGSTAPTVTGTGGNASGGIATLRSQPGVTVNAGQISATATANALQGGNATGGSAEITAVGGLIQAAQINISTIANAINTAVATGGSILFGTAGGRITAGNGTFDSSAAGGATNTAGQVVAGVQANGRVTFDNFNVTATGTSGGQAMEWVAITNGLFAINDTAIINASGNVNITTATGGLIGGPTVAAPTASIDITSMGTITIDGDNDNRISFGGQSLELISAELDILAGARIGGEIVDLESINVTNTAILGGTTEEAGYTLTAIEAERIEVGEFSFAGAVINSADPNTPDIIVRDITASGSDGDGTRRVEVQVNLDPQGNPGGILRIEGEVAYLDAAAGDELEFEAGERIEIVTPGGVAVVGTNGIVNGDLRLEAPDIWAADAATIALLQADPTFAGRNDVLSSVDAGSADPLGYIRGGSVVIEAAGTVLVRNTGTADEQGGITVGVGGLSIAADPDLLGQPTADPLDVIAYGRQQNADGTFVVGEAFYELVNFNRADPNFPTSYVAGSLFNDCDINTGECPNNIEEILEMTPPVNNPVVLNAPITEPGMVPQAEDDQAAQFGVEFPSLVDADAVVDQGALDDGVMSGGDTSLYSVSDAGAEDDETAAEGGE